MATSTSVLTSTGEKPRSNAARRGISPRLGGLLVDAASDAPAQALEAYLTGQKKDSKDPQVGRKLGRLLRKVGFVVETMGASYEVITETLLQIGLSLAEQFVTRASCSIEDRLGNLSLFVALAWCEAVGSAR